MICKHCGASFTGNVCPVCKKEAVLNDRSRDFEKLMEGVTPAVPVPPPADISGKTYQQGLQEGYKNGFSKGEAKGREEGRKVGLEAGKNAGAKEKKKTVILLLACALAACLISGSLSYLIFHKSVYNDGKTAGIAEGTASERRNADAEWKKKLETETGKAREEGRIQGEATGKNQGYGEGLAEGMHHGYEAGSVLGNMQGYASGIVTGNQYGNASGLAEGKDEGYELGRYAGANDLPEIDGPLINGYPNETDENGPVHMLQNALNELGYNCGNVDGKFGGKTEGAVKEYQKQHSYPETGAVDQYLFTEICREADAIRKEKAADDSGKTVTTEDATEENIREDDAAEIVEEPGASHNSGAPDETVLDPVPAVETKKDVPEVIDSVENGSIDDVTENAEKDRSVVPPDSLEENYSGMYKCSFKNTVYVAVDAEVNNGMLKIKLIEQSFFSLDTGVNPEDIAGEYRAEPEPRTDGVLYYTREDGTECYFYSDTDGKIQLKWQRQERVFPFERVE